MASNCSAKNSLALTIFLSFILTGCNDDSTDSAVNPGQPSPPEVVEPEPPVEPPIEPQPP